MKAWSLILSKEVSVTKEGDHYVDQDGNLWNDFELACLQEDTNWKQVHIQAAIAAMQGAINVIGSKERIARMCVEFADALVEELQKKGGQNE
jgi:hypothetical protein